MGTLSNSCPHCLHEKTLFQPVWQIQDRDQRWQTYFLCTHCAKGVTFVLSATSPQAAQVGPMKVNADLFPYFVVHDTWPRAQSLAAPEFTPPLVAKRFIEGEDAYLRRRWNSAVAMYRSALDIATKGMEGVPVGKSFFMRLKWMSENGLITADIRAWADQVRVEGNDALHDEDEFDERDAVSLRYFTEMFLRYVFELPGKVAEFRGRGTTNEEK